MSRRNRLARPVRSGNGRRRWAVEALEGRLLLTASVSGTVFNDIGENGTIYPSFGLANWRVYVDSNGNGSYDAGEPTALSDTNGQYTITGITAGTRTLREVIPSGYYATAPASGTRSVSLVDGQTLASQDFGNAKLSSVSGTVFSDLNADGIRQSSEPVKSGVTLFIDTNENGVLDSGEPSSTSDASGHYAFTGLRFGDITVRPVLPGGFQPSTSSANGYGIGSGTDYTTDWGFTQLSIMRGIVYTDDNSNGMADATDGRLGGVTVYLDLNHNGQFDAGETSTQSQPNSGWYEFGAPAGTYTLREVVPSGYALDAPTGGSYSVTLANLSGQGNLNFGHVVTAAGQATVSGSVFNDLNGDGTARGAGLAGWRVYVDSNHNNQYDSTDPSALTDSSGAYSITGVAPGSYTLGEVAQSGWYTSTPSTGTRSITLTAGQTLTGQDFGDFEYGTISGTVYNDLNGDTVRQAGEPGLAGWQVFIDRNGDSFYDTGDLLATTDATGHYVFSNVPAGNSRLMLILQPGWYTFLGTSGVYMGSGQTYNSDWPVTQSAVVTGHVYDDLNQNGLDDNTSDLGLAGFTVYADLNNNGQLDPGEPSTTSNNIGGGYYLGGLQTGTYTIREAVPAAFQLSQPAAGAWTVFVSAPGNFPQRDFGNVPRQYGTITGTIFDDRDNDGVLNPIYDLPAAGRTVYVDLNDNNAPTAGEPVATSDANGNFIIPNVPASYAWHVREVPFNSTSGTTWRQTYPLNNAPQTISVAPNGTASGVLFGIRNYTLNATLSGQLFVDSNGDGTYEAGTEVGLAGRTVYIDANNNGQLDPGETSTVTVGLGSYTLRPAAPGHYIVRQVLPAGWVQTTPTGGQAIQWVALGGVNQTGANFGSALPVSFSGHVFNDLNHDGIRQPGEPPLVGWTFGLTNPSNSISIGETGGTTDAAGNYSFNNMPPGTWIVYPLTIPSGWRLTAPLTGTPSVSLTSGQSGPGPVLGYVQLSTVPMDFNYLLTLAQHYGRQGTFATGDLNDDGTVNFTDLLLLGQSYGHPLSAANSATELITPVAKRKPRAG